MNWIIADCHNLLVTFCGVFYAVLCVFSIVTGLLYASGKRKLNPLELSENMVKKLDSEEKETHFAKKMGWVTFAVGFVQGLTAFSLFKGYHLAYYFIALGFTVFSIFSALAKLKGRWNLFSFIKLLFYLAIFVILMLDSTRILFF